MCSLAVHSTAPRGKSIIEDLGEGDSFGVCDPFSSERGSVVKDFGRTDNTQETTLPT